MDHRTCRDIHDDVQVPQVDPLEGFEPPDLTEEPQQGHGHRLRKPSAYVHDIAQGQGTSSGCVNAPAYPRGMPIPSQNTSGDLRETAAIAALQDHKFTPNSDHDDVELKGELVEFALVAAKSTGDNPKNVEEARKPDDWPEWDASIKKELQQHAEVGTWELVEPPKGANIVGSRVVLHYKHDATGSLVSRKSRVVAQGFSQAEGIDYNETFAPTAQLSAIRIIVALSARNE
jgi:Reverse transcriptase (RNA-dependent DNA polymerase)